MYLPPVQNCRLGEEEIAGKNPSAFGKQKNLYCVHFNYPAREHSSLGESPVIPQKGVVSA